MPGIRKLYKNSSGNLTVLNDSGAVIPGSLIGAASIQTAEIAPGATQVQYNGAIASVAIGLSSVFGAASTLTPDSGFSQINPKTIQYVLAGTFSSDSVTVQVTATYNDTTTATYTPAAFTSTGTTNKVTADFASLVVDNKRIVSLAFVAKTNQASTSVTLAINVLGTEIV